MSITGDRPVVIVGGGPVGLTFALELARYGVPATLIEPRTVVEHARPRAKTTSVRSMELFRRLGVADEIRRRAGLPVTWSNEVRFCTTAAGREITRLGGVLGLDLADSDLAAEAAQQVTQPDVEEVLREAVAASPLIDARYGWRATAVATSHEGARVTIAAEPGEDDAAGAGAEATLESRFVVGADGSRSVVRPAIGARYEGAAGGRPNVNITFRSRELGGLAPDVIHNWVLNPEAPGVVGPLDLDGTWWSISTGLESIADDAEAVAAIRRLVGVDIDVEVLATDPWQARMLLADHYGDGCGFLIGDAAHQNPPWGGHGFNTGVGDAVNLAFKIAGAVAGWGSADLLASYESERRPIAQQTIDLAATNMRSLSSDLADPALMLDGPDGDEARSAAAATIEQVKRAEFYSLGLVLGYGYGPDSAAQTPTLEEYVPIAAAGNRLPHARNDRGESLFDLLGVWFTLLVADASADDVGSLVSRWERAAAERGLPLTIVDLSRHGFAPVAGRSAVLVRPDQHIAWLGPAAAEPGDALAEALRGFR